MLMALVYNMLLINLFAGELEDYTSRVQELIYKSIDKIGVGGAIVSQDAQDNNLDEETKLFDELVKKVTDINIDKAEREGFTKLLALLKNKAELYEKIKNIFLNKEGNVEEKRYLVKNLFFAYLTKEVDLINSNYTSYSNFKNAIVENEKQIWLEFFKTQLETILFFYYKLGFKGSLNKEAVLSEAVNDLCPTINLENKELENFCQNNNVIFLRHGRSYLKTINKTTNIDEITFKLNLELSELNNYISNTPVNYDYCEGNSNPSFFVRNCGGVPKINSFNNKIYEPYKELFLTEKKSRNNYKNYVEGYLSLAKQDYGVLLFSTAFTGQGSKEKNYYNQSIKTLNPENSIFNDVKWLASTKNVRAPNLEKYLACSRKHEAVNSSQVYEALRELSEDVLNLVYKIDFKIAKETKNVPHISNVPTYSAQMAYEDYYDKPFTDSICSIISLFRYSPVTLGRVLKLRPGLISFLEQITEKVDDVISREKRNLLAFRIIGATSFIVGIFAIPFTECSSIGLSITALSAMLSSSSAIYELINIVYMENQQCGLKSTASNRTQILENSPIPVQKNLEDQFLEEFWSDFEKNKEVETEIGISKAWGYLDALTIIMDGTQILRLCRGFFKMQGLKTTVSSIAEFVEIMKKTPQQEKALLKYLYQEVKNMSKTEAVEFLKNISKDSKLLEEGIKAGFKSNLINIIKIKTSLFKDERAAELYKIIFDTKKTSVFKKSYRQFINELSYHISDDIALTGKSLNNALDDAIAFFTKANPEEIFFRSARFEDIISSLSKYQKILDEESYNKLEAAVRNLKDDPSKLFNSKVELLNISKKTKRGTSSIIELEIDGTGSINIKEITNKKGVIVTTTKRIIKDLDGEYSTGGRIIVEKKGKTFVKYLTNSEAEELNKYYKYIAKYCKEASKGK